MMAERSGYVKKWILDAVEDTLQDTALDWDRWKSQLETAGWDLLASDLAVSEGSRIHLEVE